MIGRGTYATEEFILKHSIPEPNSGCWLWLGPMSKNTGYGSASASYEGLGSHWIAHRLSFFLFKVLCPDDYKLFSNPRYMIRHICHNKLCVNPEHLKIGTAKDNCDDNKRKWA